MINIIMVSIISIECLVFIVINEKIYLLILELKNIYKPFESFLISSECQGLVRFDFLNGIFRNCTMITVDMKGYQNLNCEYWLLFCKQMVNITMRLKNDENKLYKLIKIVILKINGKQITLPIWSKIRQKYEAKHGSEIWYKSLKDSRYDFEHNLKIYFKQSEYDNYVQKKRKGIRG